MEDARQGVVHADTAAAKGTKGQFESRRALTAGKSFFFFSLPEAFSLCVSANLSIANLFLANQIFNTNRYNLFHESVSHEKLEEIVESKDLDTVDEILEQASNSLSQTIS